MSKLESLPLLELSLSADPQSVPAARHRAMRACTEAGLMDDDCFSLDLALGEALANAVTHGVCAQHGDSQVFVSLWGYNDRLIIQVRDRGSSFHPPPPPYPMPPALWETTHGRGLPLMQTLTDAMVVCRGDAHEGGASVYLVKKIVRRD